MEYTWGSNFTSAHLGTSIILSSVLSGLAESIIVLRLDSRDIQPVAEFNIGAHRGCVRINHATCKHLGPQGMFRWLMTTIIVTNEFVQINRSLSLIWSYVKRGPSILLFKKAISVFNSYICQD